MLSGDPYEVLGLTPPVTHEAVREASKRLARQHHPDIGGDAATFAAVTDARDRLLALADVEPPLRATEEPSVDLADPWWFTRSSAAGHRPPAYGPPRPRWGISGAVGAWLVVATVSGMIATPVAAVAGACIAAAALFGEGRAMTWATLAVATLPFGPWALGVAAATMAVAAARSGPARLANWAKPITA